MEWCPGHRVCDRHTVKKLFPGLNSAVILRSPAKRRTARTGPPSWIATFEPPTVPDTVVLLYVTKSGDGRLAKFYTPAPADFVFSVADRLAGGTLYPGIRSGWLFNEQVVSHLVTVEPL